MAARSFSRGGASGTNLLSPVVAAWTFAWGGGGLVAVRSFALVAARSAGDGGDSKGFKVFFVSERVLA